ncbi:THO complex subunit 4B [Glycine max]|nr:THO complex subunit 4B [Glycine max]
MIAFLKMVLEELGATKIESGTKLYLFNLDHGVADDNINVSSSSTLLSSEEGEFKRYTIHYMTRLRDQKVLFVRHSDYLVAIKKYNNIRLDGKPSQIEFVGTCPATLVVTPLCQTN